MSSSTLTIRIDDDLKRGASEVADYYGLDLSSVTRAFYKQMVNTRRIPLTFAPDEPSSESLEACLLYTSTAGRSTTNSPMVSERC